METYKLRVPVQNGSETITEFEIQPLKARHIRGISSSPSLSELLDVVGKMCAQPKHVIDELSIADALALTEIVGNGLGTGLQTGNPASE